MRVTFLDLIIRTLDKAQIPLTPDEIWTKSKELKTRQGFETKGETPVASIGARCYMWTFANDVLTLEIPVSNVSKPA